MRVRMRAWIGVEAGAPETIADDHNGRVAWLVQFGAEQSSTLSIDAEDGEIIGRYELSKDPLWFRVRMALQADVEWDAVLDRGHSGKQAFLLPILLDVVIRDRFFRLYQLVGVRR